MEYISLCITIVEFSKHPAYPTIEIILKSSSPALQLQTRNKPEKAAVK
jgi:hypothetical protein